MFVSKLLYFLGAIALSYLCGRIVRMFERNDAVELNFFTKTLCSFLTLAAIPGYLLVGWWLDSFIDSSDDGR